MTATDALTAVKNRIENELAAAYDQGRAESINNETIETYFQVQSLLGNIGGGGTGGGGLTQAETEAAVKSALETATTQDEVEAILRSLDPTQITTLVDSDGALFRLVWVLDKETGTTSVTYQDLAGAVYTPVGAAGTWRLSTETQSIIAASVSLAVVNDVIEIDASELGACSYAVGLVAVGIATAEDIKVEVQSRGSASEPWLPAATNFEITVTEAEEIRYLGSHGGAPFIRVILTENNSAGGTVTAYLGASRGGSGI